MPSAGCDDKWRKFHPELLDEEIRCGIEITASEVSVALLKPCASLPQVRRAIIGR
jgi:hypothetical protein